MNTFELTKEILRLMSINNLTLTTVESCTGGRIASAITEVPGASTVFPGGLIAYHNWVKQEFLSVDKMIIEKYDVVSERVVVQMVKGGIKRFQTDYAIATTGYAGPSSENNHIPVGTIWIGCGNSVRINTKKICLNSERTENLQQTVKESLQLLLETLSHDIDSEK